MTRGIPGRTHCGKWTNNLPTGVFLETRLVCVLPADHGGLHRCRGWVWAVAGDLAHWKG